MDLDDADVEGPFCEGGLFQDLDDWPDRVVSAQVVVQPQLVQPPAPVPVEKCDSSSARPGHLGAAAIHERAEIIDQNDGTAGNHAKMMPVMI